MKQGNNFTGFFSFFFLLIFSILISISCTIGEPKITYGFLSLVLYQDDSGYTERFSLFILGEDEDGIENLDQLYLYHDRDQLRWRIKSDEWQRYTIDGKIWIGTRSIAIPEGSLPRGIYRAVLVNKGGESAQKNFTYDGVIRFQFPELIIADGEYVINSQWPVNKLVCYDNSGNFTNTVTLNARTGKVSELRLPSSARTAALWAEDEENFCSAFTDAVPLY